MSGGRNDLRFTAVDLLMAIQVRQCKVRVAVCPSLGTRHDVVFVEFLLIEEGLPTHLTDITLVLGDFL